MVLIYVLIKVAKASWTNQNTAWFFHFQGDNALSNFAMHSSHILMSGVKQTMDLAMSINPLHLVNMVTQATKPFMEFME